MVPIVAADVERDLRQNHSHVGTDGNEVRTDQMQYAAVLIDEVLICTLEYERRGLSLQLWLGFLQGIETKLEIVVVGFALRRCWRSFRIPNTNAA